MSRVNEGEHAVDVICVSGDKKAHECRNGLAFTEKCSHTAMILRDHTHLMYNSRFCLAVAPHGVVETQ